MPLKKVKNFYIFKWAISLTGSQKKDCLQIGTVLEFKLRLRKTKRKNRKSTAKNGFFQSGLSNSEDTVISTARDPTWKQAPENIFQPRRLPDHLDLMPYWCGKHSVQIRAYCLMFNHVHLIAVPETRAGGYSSKDPTAYRNGFQFLKTLFEHQCHRL